MRRRFLLLPLALACAVGAALLLRPGQEDAPAPAPQSRVGTEPAEDGLYGLRRYETLVGGRRAGVYEVVWEQAGSEERPLLRDITRHRQRTNRIMGGLPETFESETRMETLRTEEGELVSMVSETRMPGRTDRTEIRRTDGGYAVENRVGDNRESFEVAAEGPAMVDAEAFLGAKIRSGEARPGTVWPLPLLDTRRRRLVEHQLEVVGPDEEGPGLKVVESFEGNRSLWWFDEQGIVVRIRAGDTVTRRADDAGLGDLPSRPASYWITLPSDVELPRIFTCRRLRVRVEVEVDETTPVPRIPEDNPFTRALTPSENSVVLELTSHDVPDATTDLPIDPSGLEKFLEPTPLMEVDDPVLREHAQEAVGGERDARKAAARIADYVFRTLAKGSPPLPEPTALEILRHGTGDCSEHALLFTALCRAAGIPARRCSGWVCIGRDWGGHAWCEIWVGRWIGADPTTNEIGTRARYIFLARPDDPEVVPGRIVAERTSIHILEAEFADGTLDLREPGWESSELYSGLRLAEIPDGWELDRRGKFAVVRGEGFTVGAWIEPDHGCRALDLLREWRLPLGERTTFGGRPSLHQGFGRRTYRVVPLGRQNLWMQATGSVPWDRIEDLFDPTLNRDDGS